MQKYNNTIRLLWYNNHICYVSSIIGIFQAFRCPNCGTFSSRTFNVERLLTTSFISFINRVDGLSPKQFKRVHMNDIPVFEDLRTFNILFYDMDIVIGNIIGELAKQSVQKYKITVTLLG